MEKRNDVVLAFAHYSDSQGGKVRPCIVLSGEEYNREGYVMIAPMTTAQDRYCLPITEADAGCRLAAGTFVRCDTIFRLHSSNVNRRIGRVKEEFYWALVGKVRGLIE